MGAELKEYTKRLQAIPSEERRLVEEYSKGLMSDFLMQQEMDSGQKERLELEKRKGELERRLALVTLTQTQEIQIRRLVARANDNLKSMDFAQKQELLRMLVEEVVYTPGPPMVKTIIPLTSNCIQSPEVEKGVGCDFILLMTIIETLVFTLHILCQAVLLQ